MKKLLLLTGDIAAGKSTFSRMLSERYHTAAFQKDSIKEVLADHIGFNGREENRRLSGAALGIMYELFARLSVTGQNIILEANFHEAELEKLHALAREKEYDTLTLVLRGDPEVLHQRYVNRMEKENRHPAHLSTAIHIQSEFIRAAEFIRRERTPGDVIEIDATDFSYQGDEKLLERIGGFLLC